MSGRRRIGPVDTIWLNMDRPDNLMVIDSLLFFDRPIDWDRVLAVLGRRLVHRYPVFHQRPVPPRTPVGLPHWEDDPDFSIERHIRRARLAPPGDDECLQRYVERHMHRPLDRHHPLWEVHFIDGYRGGAALFCRYHHALADGIALAGILLSLTDATPGADLSEATEPGSAGARRRGPTGVAIGAVGAGVRTAGAVGSALVAAVSTGGRLLADLPRLAAPGRLGDLLVQAQRTAAIGHKLVLGHDQPTALAGQPGIRKRAVWSMPFPLAEVKHVGRLAGATVNDVLMSAVAGAISSYLVDRGDVATDLTTMVPVNVRPVDRPLPRELGNRFALVMVKLPSGVREPLARLAETKRRMDVIKNSAEVVITFGLISAIGRTCQRLEKVLVDFFADKAIGVTTNVAGPSTARYVAGAKIVGVLAWVPSSGKQTLGVCMVTYDDTVRVGFKVDAVTVPDPDALVRAFDLEVEHLIGVARAF